MRSVHSMQSRTRFRTRSHRGGWTLIQMLTFISCALVLTGMLTGVLSSVMRTQVIQQDSVRLVQLRSRLGRTFREDVHAAERVQLIGEGGRLTLLGPAGKVLYRREPLRLVREATDSEGVVRFETWPLDLAEVAFEVDRAETPQSVSLSLRTINRFTKSDMAVNPDRDYRVTARLARDLRFVAGGAP